jgi:hypothetical protein
LKKIERNLNDYTGGSSTAPRSPAPFSSPAKAARKLQVNELVITGAKLQVNTSLSAGRTLTLSIPNIHESEELDSQRQLIPIGASLLSQNRDFE